MSFTQQQRDNRAEKRAQTDAKGFDVGSLEVQGSYLLELKTHGELHGVYLDGKRRGWHNVFVGSLADARKQYNFHVKDRPDRMAKLVSQKGVIEETSKFEEEDL